MNPDNGKSMRESFFEGTAQPSITCSKLTIETLEQSVKIDL